MSEKILIEGPSGTGKSSAIEFLDPEETFVICCDRKPLPFRGSQKRYKTVKRTDGSIHYGASNYVEINSMVDVRTLVNLVATRGLKFKNIVIDTISHALVASVMRELLNDNWTKYKVFAQEFMDLLNDIPGYRSDLFVFINSHVEEETVNSMKFSSFKIPAGRFTKEVIEPESLFTIVLGSECQQIDGRPQYCFITNNTGNNKCKSPKGMFSDLRIPNNLKYVRECIESYYKDEEVPRCIKQVEPERILQPAVAESF